MHYKALTEKILKIKPTKGKTPDQTVLAVLERDKKRFEKVGKGVYRARDGSDPVHAAVEAATHEEGPAPKAEGPPVDVAAPSPSPTFIKAAKSGKRPKGRRPEGPRPKAPSPLPPISSSPVIEALISTAKFLGATTKKSVRSSLGAVGKVVSSIALGKPGLKFDAAAAKEMFHGGAWIQTHSVNLDELREFLPENTVSPKAHRVQVWAPMKEAVAKYLPQVAASYINGRTWCTVVGEETTVIEAKDGDEHLSCTCTKFDDSKPSLCAHLLASIYTVAPGLADAAMVRGIFPTTEKYRQWTTALKNLREESEGMKSNVLYYFVKDILTGFDFNLARCETPREEARAFVLARSGK